MGGGGVVRAGENMKIQILARQKLCHFLKMSENYVWFPIIAHEKQWVLAMPTLYLHKSLKNTEQIAHKNFAQNRNCRNSSLHNPPTP